MRLERRLALEEEREVVPVTEVMFERVEEERLGE